MAKPKTFKVNLTNQNTKTESLTAYVDADGNPTTEAKSVRSESGDVTILDSIESTEKMADLFGSIGAGLKFLTGAVNAKLRAEFKGQLLKKLAGPDKIISDTREKLEAAGTPADQIEMIIATMRATLIG